ncbi:hypothetical protein [Allorhodopirellula solitaria]|uniref:Uncharacterized protein n=1 Tax=Allorhodopirellula solitaria TaxID=2527987 RepID=A0A5C5XWU4_9BACT|nr:hypothetical protein [Allorhodopirellula solitaria]TWT66365.1 hypothetical protein CA85_24590 [Allorhodopirellula solitaria]
MRGQQDPGSSFELFLDTICNTFGGIVFLAILLAVMLQNRAMVQMEESDAGTQASAEQVRKTMAELAEVSSKQQLLKMSLSAMPSRRTSVDDREFLRLQQRQSQLMQGIDAALAGEADTSKLLAERLEANAVQRLENAAIPEELREARRLAATTRSEFKRLVDSKQETLRVPRVRSSGRSSLLVLIQDSKLYLAKMPSSFSRGFNEKQVSTRTAADTGIEITPIANTGWDLRRGEGAREFQHLVQQAKSGGHAITIAIWPDSYEQFSDLRERMIESGVLYQLWPQSNDDVLKVYIGVGTSSVQ